MTTGSGGGGIQIGSGGVGGGGGGSPSPSQESTNVRNGTINPHNTVEAFSYIVNRNGCYFIVSGDGKKLSDCFESHAAADKARKEMTGSAKLQSKTENRGM